MEPMKCAGCGAELNDSNKCACNPETTCKACCSCPADCSCGCKAEASAPAAE